MAKKNSRYYPVVRSAPMTPSGAAPNTVLDFAKFCSMVNRRLYRQGRYYELKIEARPDFAGPVEVYVLRNDWAVQKAYQMAYQAYLDNTMDEREKLASSQVSRWEDFRVRSGITLGVNEAQPTLLTPAGTGVSLTAGSFVLSNVVDGAGVERTFTWGAGDPFSYGILEQYDLAGNQQATPDSDTNSGPYANLDQQIDAQVMQNLQEDGSLPPYDQTGVAAASPWVRVAVLGSNAAGVQKLSTGYFTAPCGLVLLVGYGEGTPRLEVEAKAGDYKGVHAPSMIEIATVNRKRKVVK